MKVLYKSIALVFVLSLLVALVPRTNEIASAQEDYNVTLGEDKIITTCNFHNTEIQVSPNHPGQSSPSIIEATSNGQESSCHILSETYQEGYAKGWAGINFSVGMGSDGQIAQEAEITLTFDYSLSVDFQPLDGWGGSADAIIYGSIAGNQTTVDRINFVHYSNSNNTSDTIALTRNLTLYAGQNYQVFTHIYSYGDIYGGGYAYSQSYVNVLEVKIAFMPTPTPTPDPCTITITANPPEGANPGTTGGPYAVPCGCTMNITANTNTSGGYIFAGWTPIDGVTDPSAENTTVLISQSRNLTAKYILKITPTPTPTPTVQITGPAKTVLYNPTSTSPFITLNSIVNPSGGTYKWEIISGIDKAAFLSGSKTDRSQAHIQGIAGSSNRDDVVIKLTYTVNSQTCETTHTLTVQKPTHLKQEGAEQTELQFNLLGQLVGYHTYYNFSVRDQFNDPILRKGMKVIENRKLICTNYHPFPLESGNTKTNQMGWFVDELGRWSRSPLLDLTPIHQDLLAKVQQQISVAGWHMPVRCQTYYYGYAASNVGACTSCK